MQVFREIYDCKQKVNYEEFFRGSCMISDDMDKMVNILSVPRLPQDNFKIVIIFQYLVASFHAKIYHSHITGYRIPLKAACEFQTEIIFFTIVNNIFSATIYLKPEKLQER